VNLPKDKFCKEFSYNQKEENQSRIIKKRWNLKDIKVKYFLPPRYLIVEDNYAGRSELGRMIQIDNSKHFIDLVDNGPEAIEKFSKMICQGYIYDFIFLDIEIPDINGIDVASYIREKEKIFGVHTNIAAVTGKNVSEIPSNIFDYICKNIFLIYLNK
jgi:DNA-binding LytR/AlgR family response regulator